MDDTQRAEIEQAMRELVAAGRAHAADAWASLDAAERAEAPPELAAGLEAAIAAADAYLAE